MTIKSSNINFLIRPLPIWSILKFLILGASFILFLIFHIFTVYKYDFEMSTWSHGSWFFHNGFLCQFIDKSLAYEKEF